MNPIILSPFFLLRSTQTEGPESSGPSILPVIHSIWNTEQWQSFPCRIKSDPTLWCQWLICHCSSRLQPHWPSNGSTWNYVVGLFIYSHFLIQQFLKSSTLKLIWMRMFHFRYSAQGRQNLNQLNLGGKMVYAAPLSLVAIKDDRKLIQEKRGGRIIL